MKKITLVSLIITLSFSLLLYSCGGKTKKETDNSNKSEETSQKESKNEDKNNEQESLKQDSIAALEIKGYDIKMVQNGGNKYSKTELEYENLWMKISESKKTSEKEMWEPGKLENRISALKESYKGGMLTLRVYRLTIDGANTDMFTVIVKDSSEKELYREELEEDIAETPVSGDLWWNIATVGLSEKVPTPFYVYVIDKLADKPYKFLVSEKN